MKKISLLFTALILFGCKKDGTTPSPLPQVVSQQNGDRSIAEQKQIEAVVRKAYAWAAGHRRDGLLRLKFDASDTIISGFDMAHRDAYLSELKRTGCFTDHFITMLDDATAQLNNKLGTGKILWSTEDVPPIAAAEMEAWCKCSNPDEFSTYDKIIIVFDNISADEALLHWNWNVKYGDVKEEWPKYHITLLKNGVAWKIDYMEGFDEKNYMP